MAALVEVQVNMELTNIDQIKELLARHGFRFSKSLGQNFLTQAWVPEDIAASAELDDKTGVLEVGPGIGCLTKELSQRAGKVVSVELDKALKPILAETLSDCNNVEIVYGDVLKQNLPALAQEKFGDMRKVICANLPYNVTTPLLTAFIESGCFETITVMIQREVAKRICSTPGNGDYGAFGIYVQWYMDTELLFDVPPSCFIPQPKVTSSVIRLKRRRNHPAQVQDEELMFKIIRAAFNQRRKTLVNAISSQISNITKEQATQAIENCGFDNRIRGEVLDIGGFAKISDEIAKIIGSDL
jgi:16S rRNA (adenine1518-N6/adenine1519-N6)-dimethyltransferase